MDLDIFRVVRSPFFIVEKKNEAGEWEKFREITKEDHKGMGRQSLNVANDYHVIRFANNLGRP